MIQENKENQKRTKRQSSNLRPKTKCNKSKVQINEIQETQKPQTYPGET